jgi:hypothetical protein
VVTDDNELPDFIARYNLKAGGLFLTAAVLARQLTYNWKDADTTTSTGDIDKSTTAVGVSISGKFAFGKDDLKFGINTGSGMGRYIGLNFANGGTLVNTNRLDADTNPDTSSTIDTTTAPTYEINAVDSTAIYLGYRHFWTDKLRSSFTYSMIEADNDLDALADATWAGKSLTKSSSSVRANLFYSPVPKLTVGVELSMATLERESLQKNITNEVLDSRATAEGDMTRLQFIAKLDF